MWVIGDLDSSDGFQVVKDALNHLQTEGCSSRIGFIHVETASARTSTGHSSSTFLHQLVSLTKLRAVPAQEVIDLIEHNNESDASFKSKSGVDEPQKPLDRLRSQGVRSHAFKDWRMDWDDRNLYSTWVEAGTEVASKLGIEACGRPHLIVNGRVSHKHNQWLISACRTYLCVYLRS